MVVFKIYLTNSIINILISDILLVYIDVVTIFQVCSRLFVREKSLVFGGMNTGFTV